MKDKKFKKITVIITMLIFWEAISFWVNSPVILPSIEDTLKEMGNIITSRNFPSLVLSSCLRALLAFFISLFFGIFMALSCYILPILETAFDLIAEFFSTVPTVAIILLILIWFKANTVSILVSILMVCPIIYKNVKYSIKNYDKDIISMLDLYKVPMSKRIIKVYIPKIFIDLNAVISTSFLINFKMSIAGEVLSQPKYAIGTALNFEKAYLNTAGVFAYIIIILILSKFLELIVNKSFLILTNKEV